MNKHTYRRTDGRVDPSGRSVPRNLAKRWRKPLLKVRRAIDKTHRLVDQAERLTRQAEWLLRKGRNAAQTGRFLGRAWDRLTRATRCHVASNWLLVHAGNVRKGAERMPRLYGQTSAETSLAGALIQEITERIQTDCAHFFTITVEITGGGLLAAERKRHLPKHPRPAPDVRFDHEEPPSPLSSDYSEGFRRVTRGRAPPACRTARLHALLAAAEEPVRLRSLS